MIITKTPFRISFVGGGSDMENFYKEYEGHVLCTTINRYMYIMIHPYFDEKRIALKYSQNEIVDSIEAVQHMIFKQVLKEKRVTGVEISSTADVPSGTGLGSSSAFTVGLLHTLACYKGKYCSKEELAKEACRIEIEEIGSPIGKQDQYAVSFGGLNYITFRRDGSVLVEPVIMKQETYHDLENNLVMFYTGLTHNANDILAEQKRNIVSKKSKTNNLIDMCVLAKKMKESLEKDNIDDVGGMLNENWQKKKELASGITNNYIDELYEKALKSGATGGKLLGAGGGGFLLMYCPHENQEYLANKLGLRTFPFSFEQDGTSVIYVGNKYWEDSL